MIKKYYEIYFDDIYKITKGCWSGEFKFSDKIEKIIYQLLPKYSLINGALSFVDLSNKVDSFMFAGYKNDFANISKWLKEAIAYLNEEEKEIVNDYFNYLEFNHNKVTSHMKDSDIYLSLIASVKKNSGTFLLENLCKIADNKNCNIYLWTDETCNYKYYEARGFKIVEEYYTTIFNKKIKTFVYKK